VSAAATWEIVTSLVDSLAWPLIVLIALVMLRPSIRRLINLVSRFKYGDAEFYFGKKDRGDLEERTISDTLTNLDPQPSPLSMRKLYGYLNYKGGNSNFWVFGISTGDKLNVTAYPFRELTNESCYFSLGGSPDPGQVELLDGTTIAPLLQVPLSPYSSKSPYNTTLTIPNYADLTTPPYEAEITNIEIDSEGPVAFIIEVVEQNTR